MFKIFLSYFLRSRNNMQENFISKDIMFANKLMECKYIMGIQFCSQGKNHIAYGGCESIAQGSLYLWVNILGIFVYTNNMSTKGGLE